MAEKKLKVFGWIGSRREAGPRMQTREIVAAASKAAAARAAGVDRPAQLWNLSDTGNAFEIAQAMREPGTVFWRELDAVGNTPFNPAPPVVRPAPAPKAPEAQRRAPVSPVRAERKTEAPALPLLRRQTGGSPRASTTCTT